MAEAHVQHQAIHLTEYYPSHEPREGDPHYKLFNAARDRLKKLGKLVCWRCGATEQIELHHSLIEFSLANGVDVATFEKDYPEFHITSDEEFAAFVESEGNLTPLCKRCHTGIEGIHCIPYPLWLAGRFWKPDAQRPAQVG